MTTLSRVVAIAIITASITVECRGDDDRAQVKITVEYCFREEKYRIPSIYNSLQPILAYDTNRYHDRSPTKRTIKDGRLILEFEVWSFLPKEGSRFEVDFGPRRAAFVSRPIRWSKDSAGWNIGVMSPVLFYEQPDPDWLVLHRAVWLSSPDSYRILELELQNFGTQTDPGADVHFRVTSRHTIACFSGAGSAEIELSFSTASGRITMASPDPQFAELVERHFVYTIAPCGTDHVEADLGPTGPVAAGQVFRIRYRFPRSGRVRDVRNYLFRGQVPKSFKPGSLVALEEILRVGDRTVALSGARISSASVNVELP